jgi:hypothetical protein
MIYKILHRTSKIEQHEFHSKRDELGWTVRLSSSCSTGDIRRVTVVSTPVISHAEGKGQIVVTMQVLMLYFESRVLYHIYTFVDFEKQ